MNKTVFLCPLWLSSEPLNPSVVLGLPNHSLLQSYLDLFGFRDMESGEGVFFHFRRLLISLLCFQMHFCFHSCLSSWRISVKVMLALSYLSSMYIYIFFFCSHLQLTDFHFLFLCFFQIHLPRSWLVKAVPIFPFCLIYRDIISMIILLPVIFWTLLLPPHIYLSIFSLNFYFRQTICSLISLPFYSIYP